MVLRYARLRSGRWLLVAVVLLAAAEVALAQFNRAPPLTRPGLPPRPIYPPSINPRPPDLDPPISGFQAAGALTGGNGGLGGAAAQGGLGGAAGGLGGAGGGLGGVGGGLGGIGGGLGGIGGGLGGIGGLGGGFKNFGFGGTSNYQHRSMYRSTMSRSFGASLLKDAE